MDDLANSRRNFPYYRANSEAAKAAVESYLLKYEEFRGAHQEGRRAPYRGERELLHPRVQVVSRDSTRRLYGLQKGT